MISLTCILCTKRAEPKFDWMADSFARALAQVPQVPVELIVVDGCLPVIKSDRWRSLVGAVNGRFSFRHVAPKITSWQGPYRKTSRDYFALNNARNTGLALARGTHVVFFDDCTVLDENFLAHHARVATWNSAMAGSYQSYNKAQVAEGKILEGELHDNGKDRRGDAVQKAPGAWLWGLNMSFPLSYALLVNGFDEMYDGQAGSEDCDFGVRTERAGCKIVHDPECLVYQVLETHEAIDGAWTTWKTPEPVKQKERMLKDGRSHYANEFLIQELAEDPTRTAPRGNDFDLRELRERVLLEGWSAFPTQRAVTMDWRDSKPLSEM